MFPTNVIRNLTLNGNTVERSVCMLIQHKTGAIAESKRFALLL